jgi:hypothetical protein
MSDETMFDLSELAVSSIEVVPLDASGLTEGHGMTELAGSCVCLCHSSLPSFTA